MYKRNKLLLLVFFLICTGWELIAQDYYPGSQTHYQMIYEKSSEKYGVTSLLLNGVYFDDPYIGARGHPYLGKDEFRNGSIVFRNKIYSNVLLKYDIDEQRIILNHNHPDTRLVTILPNVFIESFKIGDDVFKNASVNGGEKQYYEVVFEGDYTACYFHWKKPRTTSLHLDNKVSYIFGNERNKNYLLFGNDFSSFRNNRTFLKRLPESLRNDVKTFIKSKDYNIKRISERELVEVFEFIEKRLNDLAYE